jgi:hypothetical protein
LKIYTSITWDIKTGAIDNCEFFEYDGLVALACGASSAQNDAQAAQASFYTQATQQASQVFGAGSQVYQQLQSTFAPTVAAGPDQQGFSATELSNLNSQAVTQGGVAARNAEQAAGESIAAQGGGNIAGLTSGTNAGVKANIDISAAENTANNLSQITASNYATGRQNYDTAVAGLEQAPSVYGTSTGATTAATGAGVASANTANQIASQNQSWVQAVTGALGGVAGSFASGGLSNLIGSGSGGKSTGSAPGEGESNLA